jgi:hypothetical protein
MVNFANKAKEMLNLQKNLFCKKNVTVIHHSVSEKFHSTIGSEGVRTQTQ